MRNRAVSMFVFVLSALVLAGALRAAPQGLKLPQPASYERATKTDEGGLKQWAEHEPVKCPNCTGTGTAECMHCARLEGADNCMECKGTKKAPCRVCAGTGNLPDLLEKAHCPGCLGAGFLGCVVCPGDGKQKVQGSGDRLLNCVACRGDGGFPCGVCKGDRLVEGPKVKFDKDSAKSLKKDRDEVAAVLAAVKGWQPKVKVPRKEVKEYGKLLKPAAKVLPPLKRVPKAFEDYFGKVMAGDVFIGAEEEQAFAMQRWRDYNVYYLEEELRILDLAIERAEFNEKVLEEQKDKKD